MRDQAKFAQAEAMLGGGRAIFLIRCCGIPAPNPRAPHVASLGDWQCESHNAYAGLTLESCPLNGATIYSSRAAVDAMLDRVKDYSFKYEAVMFVEITP